MAFELEALVGHLYVAGGRTIKTSPPGALCEVAPKRAARGRETDTFFVMVLPSGNVAPNTFYEQMALMASERFYSQGGSVTSALRHVYNTLNNSLYEHNHSGHKHYEANIITAVLRGEELYVARTGACAMVLWQDGEMQSYPEDLTREDALFQPPLGVQPIPDVQMTSFDVKKGSRMLLSDASIAEMTRANIRNGVQAEDLETLLDDFKARVSLQIQMMAVEFVPPDEPVLMPAVTGESTAVLSAEIAATRARTSAREAEASRNKPNPLQARAKQGVISTSRTSGHILRTLGDLMQTLFGKKQQDDEKQRSSWLVTAAVVGFPALILLIVMLSWVGGVGQTAFEECVQRAVDAGNIARGIDSSNTESVVTAWRGTLQIIENDCDTLRPEHNDPTLQSLREEGRQTIDGINQISRRSVTPVATLPVDGANIKTLVIQGLDMYALDDVNDLVYRMQLDGDDLAVVGQAQPVTSMRSGASVDGLGVGALIDIAFDSANNQIVALAENGVLVSCPPRFINECEAQRILASERWQNPTKITIWQGNLYVLDVGARQIWRYQPSGGSFASPPTEYFTGSIRPAFLQNAVDFAISENSTTRGRVYVLYGDGVLTPYYGGEALDFRFLGFRDGQAPEQVTTQAMYLSDNPTDPGIFLVSRPTRTIYKTTLGGTLASTFRVTDEALFERLNDVVADSGQGIVYAASGNTIFAFRQ
jgi:hypothetical protein